MRPPRSGTGLMGARQLAVVRPHPTPQSAATPQPASAPAQATGVRSLGRAAQIALVLALVTGLITHAYHLFQYPLYSTDEGIYVERAWAVIREDRLSPQTYVYDHAPGGWILIALWELLLPGHFETFSNPVAGGRILALLLHLGSVFFLFEIARKFSGGGLVAPAVATFLFNFSPLAIYYQRMILLDNIMVFWVLLSIYLLIRSHHGLFTGLWSGLAFGAAVVTKENAIFFAPTIFYLLAKGIHQDSNRRFVLTFWLFASAVPVLGYVLFATLKGELLPSPLSLSLSRAPQNHVSLLYELWYQIHRNQGTLFAPGSFLHTQWLPKDPFLLGIGTVAMVACVAIGWSERKQNPALLVAGSLAFEIAFYLGRGSVILDFYVLPLIPTFALCIGLVADRVVKRLPASTPRLAVPIAAALAAALLVAPSGGYVLKHGQQGQLQLADQYYLPLTYLQQEQIAWIRQHIPPTDKIITDDDIWVALHDTHPSYPDAQSHWNAVSDPRVRNIFGGGNSQDINYIVMSNGMKQAMILNNSNGQENWILSALNNATEVWHAGRGNVSLAIYQVQG
jgi:4-amino-4-deoxy-L-arabinose transferase-like glycosyltransferase